MKAIHLAIALVLVLCVGFLPSCSGDKMAQVKAKDGDSCLIEHKCQMTLFYGETTFARDRQNGSQVEVQSENYYRCYVDDRFYSAVSVGDRFKFDPDSNKNCVRLNP